MTNSGQLKKKKKQITDTKPFGVSLYRKFSFSPHIATLQGSTLAAPSSAWASRPCPASPTRRCSTPPRGPASSPTCPRSTAGSPCSSRGGCRKRRRRSKRRRRRRRGERATERADGHEFHFLKIIFCVQNKISILYQTTYLPPQASQVSTASFCYFSFFLDPKFLYPHR